MQTNPHIPEFTDPQDLTLVDYQDPGASSTLASRHLEVVYLSTSLADSQSVRSRPAITLQQEVGFPLTRVTSSRGESLPFACQGFPGSSGTLRPVLPQLDLKGEISVRDRLNKKTNTIATTRNKDDDTK